MEDEPDKSVVDTAAWEQGGIANEVRSIVSAAVRDASDSIEIFDADGRYLYVNEASERHTGYTLEELYGNLHNGPGCPTHVAPDVLSEILANVQAGKCWEGPIQVGTKSRTQLEQHATVAPVNGADGKVIGYIVIKRDVSQQLQAQRALFERTRKMEATNRQLESTVIQLHEMQNQLVRAAKIAAVGTLAAGLAHELNNPLSVILACTQRALRQMPDSSPEKNLLQKISVHAERCGNVVRSLRGYSEGFDKPNEQISASALIDRVVKVAESYARRRNVMLLTDASGNAMPRLSVSLHEMEQALISILHSAIDATEEGREVLIRAEPNRQQLRAGVSIITTDSGPGLPGGGQVKQVFEPFFATSSEDGAALALTLAQQVAEAHGGYLEIENRPGEGTSVEMWLPALPMLRREEDPDRSVG